MSAKNCCVSVFRVMLAALTALPLLALSVAPASAGSADATITILHGLPNFTADVYVNNKLTLDGFKPESATDALSLPAGTYDIAIRNVGSDPNSTPALAATITLGAGKNYTAIAHLSGAGQPSLKLFDNDLSKIPAGKSRLVVRNEAEVPPLDVRLDGTAVFKELSSDSEAVKNKAPARYMLDAVDASDGTELVAATRLDLNEGTETIVYVIGSAADQTLDFMVQDIPDLGSGPGGVSSGSGGLAAPTGYPIWAVGLAALCLAAAGCSAFALRRLR